MKVARGDVVLVDYPYSDRSGSKVRPTIVISVDDLNRSDDVILAAVTSVVRPNLASWQLLVDPAKPDARGSGLLATSVIDCGNVLTVDQAYVLKKLGRISSGVMKRIDTCLMHALGIKSPQK